MATDKVDILIRARDAFSRVTGKAIKDLKGIKISARDVKRAFLAVTASLVGLTVGLTKMFKIGSGVLETQSKFNTVFGESATRMDEFSKTFGRMAGLTQQASQDILATTAAIGQGMGFAGEASADFAQQVVTMAGDLASFNDLPTAETARAIQGAVTGEREMLKRLGIVIKEVDVQQRAMLISGAKSIGAITQQAKATATLQLISERAGVAIGDLARTQDSAANRAKQLGAKWDDVIATISTGLLPALVSVLPILDTLASKVEAMASGMAEFALNLTDALKLTDATQRTEMARFLAAPDRQAAADVTFRNIVGLRAKANRVSATGGGTDAELKTIIALRTEADKLQKVWFEMTAILIRTHDAAKDVNEELDPGGAAADARLARLAEFGVGPNQLGLGPGSVRGRKARTSFTRKVGARNVPVPGDDKFIDNIAKAGEATEDLGVTVVDNFSNMAQAAITGSGQMEAAFIGSITNILKEAVGGGILGSVIGGIGGIATALFSNKPTPVRIDSASDDFISKMRNAGGPDVVQIRLVDSRDNDIAQVEYALRRRDRLRATPVIPSGRGIGGGKAVG